MRRFLLLFATVFLSVAAFAAEELKYECLFGSSYNSKGISSYTEKWTTTNGDYTWNIVNFNNNNNQWATYVKCGSKSAASVASVTTDFACTEAISKVTITIDAVTASAVNSITLYSSTTKDFSSKTSLGTFTIAKGEQSVTIDTPTADLYYKVEFDMKKSSSNGPLTLSNVSYYSDGTGGGEVGTTVSAPTIKAEYNQVSLACETEGAKIYYTIDGTTEPTAASTEYTAPFTISGPTTVKAIAITSEGSSSVTTKACDYYITSMSEFNKISASNAAGCKVHLTNATVAYQNTNKNQLYLVDGEYGVLVYGNQSDYNPGDVITTIDGDFTIYNNLPEITNATLVGKTAGTAPTPVEATFADFTYANSNKYVVIKNVTFNSTAKTATFGDGKKLTVFSSNGIKFPGDGVYNIIGFVNIFKGTTNEIDAIEFVAKGLSFLAPSMGVVYGNSVPALPINNPAGLALTWSSSDVNVATVDADGKVTVVGVGTTTIKAAETGNESNYAELTFTVSPAAGNISYFAEKFVVITGADFVAPVLTNPHGLTVTYTSDNENVLVDENTGDVVLETNVADVTATITATAAAQGNYAESVASYTIVVKEAGAGSGTSSFSEVLTASNFKATGSSYVSGTCTLNDITYAFETAMHSSGAIRLRGTNPSGIIVTANDNGYVLRKVTVEWNSETTVDRTLDVYGKNTAYTGENAAELYGTATQGTKIGSIVCGTSTTLDIEGDYQFIGLRSNKSAMYITSITLEWEGAAAGAPTFSATLSISKATEGGESANVLSLSDITGSVELAGKNVYLNDRNICGADASATYLPYLADGVFTVVDGTTAYALNATLPSLSSISAKVESVAYKAWKDNDHLISEGMYYLDAEYTVAVDTEMDLVADFVFEGNEGKEGHVKSFTGNTAYVEGIGYFTVTPTTGSDGKTHDVYEYITDAAGDFMVTPQFPFFVKSGMSDMIKAHEGTSRIVAINGAPVVVEVENLAEQPSAEGGNVSGVESVVVDSEGAVEYYNLQGVRVEGALTPGIYIRRSGNTATKVAIR